ncbi:hypothetical protein BaRGS_00036398 [Batillaria attramentaria]|uniref:Uncharacterized protein n=1 Tax=Batillaria attramentaria TaxID=370345 RepID=A0ABD0JC38_9CAEN
MTDSRLSKTEKYFFKPVSPGKQISHNDNCVHDEACNDYQKPGIYHRADPSRSEALLSDESCVRGQRRRNGPNEENKPYGI